MITATASYIPAFQTLKPKQMAFILGRTSLIAVCALMMFAAVHPESRTAIRGLLSNTSRTVVSTASGHLAGDNREFTIAKVKTADVLSLEIFEKLGNGQEKLVEKIAMTDARDGYFDFNGRASNLAVEDINGDGRPEILVPTFDNNLVGHLSVYNLDAETNAFTKVIR